MFLKIKNILIWEICVFFQVINRAKLKGEQELIAKREKLMVELAKLAHRIKDFPECSELDLMQQVQNTFDVIKGSGTPTILPFDCFFYSMW